MDLYDHLFDTLKIRFRATVQDVEFGPFTIDFQQMTRFDAVSIEQVGQCRTGDLDR
jgi:hypothetical protein